MKKILFITIAAMAMTFAACGNKSAKSETESEGTEKETENATSEGTENASEEVSYMTYTNDKYGFSVEVPAGMEKRGESMGDEGTVFSADKGSEVTFNRIDISGSTQIFDEEYTPEKVKAEFDRLMENREVTSKECGDNYYTCTIDGDFVTQIDYSVFSGTRCVSVTICYEPDHEQQLGGEVAKHVFNSIKFK